MFGIQKQAAKVTWTILLLVALLGTLYLIRHTLLIFVLALFFAYMLTPVVDFVNRFTPARFSRTLALAIVYVILLAVLVAAGVALGWRIAEETRNLQLAKTSTLQSLHLPSWLEPLRQRLLQAGGALQQGPEQFFPVLRTIGERLVSLAGNLGYAVLVPILAFFFLKDGRELCRMLTNQFEPGERRQLVEGILNDVHVLLGLYIRALVLLSLATFTVYSMFFSIAGVPYAVLLACVAAMLEFIPVLGPLSAVIIVVVVSLASGGPSLLTLAIFFAAYRLFQDYILQPWLMSSGIELHPLIVIFGALAGEQVGGIPGMILSIPVLATLRVVWVRAQRSRAGGAQTAL
jgi:predicted PurR-regulated permease PerM